MMEGEARPVRMPRNSFLRWSRALAMASSVSSRIVSGSIEGQCIRGAMGGGRAAGRGRAFDGLLRDRTGPGPARWGARPELDERPVGGLGGDADACAGLRVDGGE